MMIRLPQTVMLPTQPSAGAGAIYAAIGASRQRVAGWRSRHGFPASQCNLIDVAAVAAVAAWLVQRGCKIQWI